MKQDWNDGTEKRWSRLFVYAIVVLFLPRNLIVRFRNLFFMNLILKTKYTLSTQFVLAHVRGNNHWRTSQVRLEILNYRTLVAADVVVVVDDDNRELKHVGRQDDDDGNQYNESMKRNK